MDSRALSVFLSVAETLNFSRSAENLHLSVSAVSRIIGRLEEELGQPLLERDRRHVRLTSAGRACREYAQRTLAEWQQLRRQLGAEGDLAGEVSLYCSVTATHSVLAPILEAFRGAHPSVEIKMHTGDQADGLGRVLDGQDDVAVTLRPPQLSVRLKFLPLLYSPLQLVMPTAACAVRDMVTAGDLDWASVPFIVPERGITKDLLDDWFRARAIRPNIYAQVAGHEAIVAMVRLGLGVGIAPELVVEASGIGAGVIAMDVFDGMQPLSVGLCSLKQRLGSPLVRSFWDVAGQASAAGI